MSERRCFNCQNLDCDVEIEANAENCFYYVGKRDVDESAECGTCAHGKPVVVEIDCEYEESDYMDSDRPACIAYEERTDSVELVAKDLAYEYRKLMGICSLPSSSDREMAYATIEGAEIRLEALGVDTDG